MKFKDFKDKVNAEIISLMETHGTDWTKPYCEKLASLGNPHNAIGGNVYRGLNNFYLTYCTNYTRPMYATYKQWTSIGGDLSECRGKGIPINYFSMKEMKSKDKNGDDTVTRRGFYKVYHVFNIDDVKNVDESKLAISKIEGNDIEPNEKCDSIISATNAKITHETTVVPCYVPSLDEIRMPKKESFNSTEDYYSTLLHELSHWTGHKSRLNRFSKERTTESYAFEELVAEISSAYLCANTGIESKPRPDHAKYLNSWLKALKDDSNHIVRAFGKASKATDFILEVK